MKIAHITTVHPVNDNRIFYKECKTLVDSGYDISLIIAGAKSEIINNIKIIGFYKEKTRIKRFFKTSFFDLIKVCKKVDADIYHFHDPEIIFAGIYLKLIGKKVIYDIHENNPAAILSKPYIKFKFIKILISKVFNIFEQMTVKFFDALVTARPDITERFAHKKIITLRNFPILPKLDNLKKLNIKKEKPVVIYVGGMTKLRGLLPLIDAFKKMDNCELWLLGPINDEDIAKEISLKPENIKYFGVVEPYEVFSYIEYADIGIITFLEAPNHIHTLATKPFEYMACGKPMIMSNFEYWKDTYKDSSLYVEPFNSKDILEKVEFLLSNKELMSKMSEKNFYLSINKFNWDMESEKLINLYERLSR
jgi:glycosyltransferase involved in cell wall biosynthesis